VTVSTRGINNKKTRPECWPGKSSVYWSKREGKKEKPLVPKIRMESLRGRLENHFILIIIYR